MGIDSNKKSRQGRAGGRGLGQSAWRGGLSVPHYTTVSQKDQTPVFNFAGRVVGHITPDGWLEKRNLDPAKHMLRKPAGWATDADHLDIPGLKGIRIVTVDGEVWEADITTFRRYGVSIDRGFGKQVALPLRFWSRRSSETEAAQQLELWAEVAP